MVIIGGIGIGIGIGIGTVEGPIVGTIAYLLLDKYFAQSGVWYLIVVGAVAIVVSLYLSRGLWGTRAHRTGFAVFPVRHSVRL